MNTQVTIKKNSASQDVIPTVGDVLEDQYGNKMVIVDVPSSSMSECYVLLNGRIKLVNPSGSFIIKSHKGSSLMKNHFKQEK